MNMHNKKRNEGGGLFLVLIISTALGIGIYSTLSLVQGEFRLNKKAATYHEAKQAAESILQTSMADLKYRFENQTAFPIDSLSPTQNPLYISDEFVNIYSAEDSLSHLVIPKKKKYTSVNDFNTQDTEVIGGQVPPGNWVYIDPSIPGNESDELAGTRVFERSIEVISKATVDRTNVGNSTVYARQFLQVRDAPLFAYAIFYNLPMEIAPGPKMDIYGNVHANGDVWLQSNNEINFHSKFTNAGELYHGRHPDSGQRDSGGSVRFRNGSGKLVNMKKDDSWPSGNDSPDAKNFSGSWLTSEDGKFYDITNQIWDNNVQTGVHGVTPQNPVGVSDYIEDTNPSTDHKESFNSAYNLIQPVLNKSQLAIPKESEDPTGYKAAKRLNEVEQQKYAYKAGLTIEVKTDGTVNYFTYKRNGDTLVYDSDGQPERVPLVPKDSIATVSRFAENKEGTAVTGGMHDKRQAKDLDIVDVDISKLKDLVHENDKQNWGNGDEQAPSRWWNGVVYVDFPQQNETSSRPDYVNPAISGWGVKLVNGSVIPNPGFAHEKDTYGTSIATNQMMYIEGNYNADGVMGSNENDGTGSPTTPDSSGDFAKEDKEAPAALIADSITFLSTNWDDANSTSSSTDSRVAANTEVSAAILTGLVPSGETGSNSYSGGVENFPRFLEKWSGKTLRLRGSIVGLFESEVGTRRWGYGNVYDAPNRAWGFHEKFGEGYLPPGTPNTRRYRAVDFQLITANEYSDYVARIKNYF